MEFVASVIGIAAVGVKLSRTLYQIGGRATGARHNINRIATQITLFSSSLKHVGHVLADSKSLHTPEAAETVQQIMDQCERLFEEIARMASGSRNPGDALSIVSANDRKQRMSILQRIRWSFEQPKVEALLAQLEYLKTTLAIVIQTLSLAALTAKAKQDDAEQAEEIREERLHVESLVFAQQLSVTVLNEVHVHSDEYRQRSPSVTSDDDISIEAASPKLLTFGDDVTSESLITLGGHLDFLDSAIKKKELQNPENSINLPADVVEELLQRWTRQPSSSQARLLEAQLPSANDAAEPAVKVQGSPTATLSPVPEDRAEERARARSEAVELPDDMRAAGHLLDPNFLSTTTTNAQYPTELSATPSDVENGLSRTISNPEQDLPPRLQITPHTHPLHAGANVLSPTADASLNFALTSPTGNIVSPSTLKYYTSELPSAPACNAAAAAAIASSSPLSHSSNYRKPYVSSVRSMTPSVGDSDDENFVDYPKRQEHKPARRDSVRSQASNRPRQDSQTASTEGGLDIPWRIRLGPNRYFDLLDGRVVGPRTPYKPNERLEWICAQPSARTEISKDWVCEQALGEMRLQFFELSAKELRGSTGQGWVSSDNGGWRVLRALSFKLTESQAEIESLVERTIDLVQEQYARAPNQPSSPPGPSKSYLRAQASTSPQSIHSSMSAEPGSTKHRSASFSNPRDRPGSYVGRDRGSLRPGGEQFQQPLMNPRELPWMPPRQATDGRPADRNRDRYHDDRYGYRDRSRGPAPPPPESDYDGGRRRRDRSFEDKKKKRSSKGGTIAKIGALTAFLDGIDNVL